MGKDIAIGAEGQWFGYGIGQIRHSVANGPPPLQCFLELQYVAFCLGAKPQRYIGSRHSLYASAK